MGVIEKGLFCGVIKSWCNRKARERNFQTDLTGNCGQDPSDYNPEGPCSEAQQWISIKVNRAIRPGEMYILLSPDEYTLLAEIMRDDKVVYETQVTKGIPSVIDHRERRRKVAKTEGSPNNE